MNKIVNRFEDDDYCAPDDAIAYLADMLGTAFRDKVIATLGGTTVSVPKSLNRLHPDHPLVTALGQDDAAEIVELIGGERLAVPLAWRSAELRLAAVADATGRGETTRQIARTLGITERQVRRLRAKCSRQAVAAE